MNSDIWSCECLLGLSYGIWPRIFINLYILWTSFVCLFLCACFYFLTWTRYSAQWKIGRNLWLYWNCAKHQRELRAAFTFYLYRQGYTNYICALRLPLLVHPSWTWTAYCKFQRTLSIEGRLLGSLHRQLMVISTAVFSDWYAKLPWIEGSIASRSLDCPSAKPFSSCLDQKCIWISSPKTVW